MSDVSRLLREKQREGWVVERGGKHYKLHHPKGGYIVVAASASDHKAIKNIQADIQRLERSHESGEYRKRV